MNLENEHFRTHPTASSCQGLMKNRFDIEGTQIFKKSENSFRQFFRPETPPMSS